MSQTNAQPCQLEDGIESRLAIVCSYVCTCEVVPNRGRRGIKLKQSCVDQGIESFNLGCDSGLRTQVFYNMTTSPPSPLFKRERNPDPVTGVRGETSEQIASFEHAYNRVRQGNGGIYTQGDMRIPDVVAMSDANGKPTQDNLLGVIEVKFPPDDWRPGQKAAYEEIAGNKDKLKLLTPAKCGCDGPRQTRYAPVIQPATETYRNRLAENGIDWDTTVIGVARVAGQFSLRVLAAGAALIGGT
ncbi:hypothetical protein EHLJMEHL_01856 [Vreelandella titanicae]